MMTDDTTPTPTEDDDTQGHARMKNDRDDEDDTEGHARMRNDRDEDDVAGHGRRAY